MAFPPFAWERPKRRAPSPWGLRKTFEKNFPKHLVVWKWLLTFAPAFEKWTSKPSFEKKLRKKFRKNLEDIRKTPYLCNRFPIKTEGIKKSDLWRDLHKQYSSTRAKLETVLGKKEPSILIYIGNELLIRNPDRATTYLDAVWYSGVKDTFTMKSLILAQDER